MRHVLRISAVVLAVYAASYSLSEAQAGGRRCHCQPMYTTAVTTTAPAMANSGTTTDGRQRYQSAYQAPAGQVQNYNYNTGTSRNTGSYWDRQTNFARHIKGL